MIEPFKYLIQAVAVERDEHGRITGEKPAQPIVVYSAAEAVKAITEFEDELARQQEGAQNGNGRAEAVPAGGTPAGRVRQRRPVEHG